VGPFLFALVAITGLVFLNAVALRIEGLVGKGLPWTVIVEFLVFSLPSTVALSLPMAVLVAVLYAFSDLATSNEITAMAAGGVRPTRLLVPLMGMGMVATMIMLFFNNTLLPEANHSLKNLLVDIGRKSPTFQLRENVVNEIHTDNDRVKYYLTAERIDPATNSLKDVTIFDSNDPLRKRITHADSGTMAFNEARTDLYLTLYHGVIREVRNDQDGGGGYQRLYFEKQVVPMRGVGTQLDIQLGASQRSDREMNFAMLHAAIVKEQEKLDSVTAESERNAVLAVATALRSTEPMRPAPGRTPDQARLERLHQQAMASASGGLFERDRSTREIAIRQRSLDARVQTGHEMINRYAVQIYKLWALAFACLVFTFLGPQLALRYPRGGVGMVIAASTAIFSVYWVGLIGGESLATKNMGSPLITMWIPNIVFALVGVLMLPGMGRSGTTARGGGWEEIAYRLRTLASKLLRRRQSAGATG
jgi:lipopolysaccharide export system permease protein